MKRRANIFFFNIDKNLIRTLKKIYRGISRKIFSKNHENNSTYILKGEFYFFFPFAPYMLVDTDPFVVMRLPS